MPIRNSQQDYLLRLIQQMAAAIAAMLGLRGGGRVDEALELAADAERELLGPLLPAAIAVDAATAAQMIGEPLKTAAWARLLAERAALLGEAGDGAAEAIAARAAALAAEARTRAVAEGRAAEVERMLAE